jgi:hypothetical protein
VRRHHRHEVVTQSGIIAEVQDCGTIVIVHLKTENGWLTPVFFDHRSFRWLLDGEGCGPEELIGRPASFDGESLHLFD